MKQFLLPEDGNFYKANMHCHSTFSDGEFSIRKIKEEYSKRGYSVVAFTDHNRCFQHTELTDENFLALTGYEIDISDRSVTNDCNFIQCYHFNCYAQTDDREYNEILPLPDYHDIDAINEFIRMHNEQGFLLCYNHPNWSLQTLDDYKNLEGLFACEVYNHSAAVDGIARDDAIPYDTFLRQGKRMFCFATDDNHNRHPIGDPMNDSFGGFIMIKAPELTYKSIINALKNGSFYASEGPEIYSMYVEDNELYIECSDASSIQFTTAGRRTGTVRAYDGERLTSARFELHRTDKYFRVQIIGKHGERAHTNAYFLDDLD